MTGLDGRPDVFEGVLGMLQTAFVEGRFELLHLGCLSLGENRKAKFQLLSRQEPSNEFSVEDELLGALIGLVLVPD